MEVQLADGVERLLTQFGRSIVEQLGEKYKFDVDTAMSELNFDIDIDPEPESETKSKLLTKPNKSNKTATKKKTNIPLPFCGIKQNGNCDAIRLNHGLYTQCCNIGDNEFGLHTLCSTCLKQAEKSSNSRPTYGYIQERIERGDDFRDPKGKPPVNYGNIMDKLNISRNEAEREAANQGVTIPENQFEIKKAQRGRPKKDTTAIDTSGSEEEPNKQEKKRGRPKKDKQVISSTNVGNSMIDNLVQKVNEAKTNKVSSSNQLIPEKADDADDDDDDDDDTIEVVKKLYEGKEYLKASDGTIYDAESWAELGTWDESSQSIVFGESNDD